MDCIAVDRVERIPATKEWFREVKWDGYRVSVIKNGRSVSIRTKSNVEPGARYKHIETSLAASAMPDCVLDAELVALDSEEHPVFQLLQQSRSNQATVVIHVFDLLNSGGRNLTGLPLQTRRAALETISKGFPEYVRLSELLPEDVDMSRLVEALRIHRLEGIVVKRKNSVYTEGKEPGTWVKYRLYEIDEFVIGGISQAQRPLLRCSDRRSS
jgi:bifunctional non-homologous end joining protein LigD